jgi:hypothetical protein
MKGGFLGSPFFMENREKRFLVFSFWLGNEEKGRSHPNTMSFVLNVRIPGLPGWNFGL